MNVYVGNRLPSTYQEVEWIGRNGNNYIDTGWVPNLTQGFKIKVGYKVSSGGNRYAIIGNYNNLSNDISLEINESNQARFYEQTTNSYNLLSSNTINTSSFNDIEYNISSTSQSINLNGTITSGTTSLPNTNNTSCYLFIDRQKRWTTFTQNSFISYCKIYQNGTIVRDFVPCYRKSDSVVGLYDLVNNQFYTNSGTGTFTKGSDVTAKGIYVGTTPVKEVYVGTTKVRPKEIFEYSYDFRNKTAAQITAAGWTIGSKGNQGYNLNANGLGNLASGDTSAWAVYPMPINITEANKITFTLGSYGGSTASYAGSIKVGLSAGTILDSPGGTQTVLQTQIHNASGSGVNYLNQVTNSTVGVIIGGTSSYGSGTGFLTCVIDFPNNTITYNKTSPVSYSTTHTMTTAEKNAILSAKSHFYVSATTYSSTTANYIQTMSIKIE